MSQLIRLHSEPDSDELRIDCRLLFCYRKTFTPNGRKCLKFWLAFEDCMGIQVTFVFALFSLLGPVLMNKRE